ncbi:hypothetical protein WI84_16395 [Burkholderia ubonensis]|uniref:hypothetical protein n=1 Tax=Burkholderia ubonensis TaxID=101571 RepID=UPI00075D09A0|nr:hypothetical protein [Burkholderia ubonensis]KVD35446.1 hypothetical protein WI84_16395 [Burkholderia ubonensis]
MTEQTNHAPVDVVREMPRFEAAMRHAYDYAPDRNPFGEDEPAGSEPHAEEAYRSSRDSDRFMGWCMAVQAMGGTATPYQLRFPAMLRKMWSGGEVQAWLDALPPLYAVVTGKLTDEQIIERCKAAGIKWIPPELPDDCDYEMGFPGSFDMVSMDEMRALLAPTQRPSGEVTDEPAPSFTNPLTPYGMLVRALRIVTQTSLYDMGQALLLSSAKLSAMEFGRAPVTNEVVREVATYFESQGVSNTLPALQAALVDEACAGDES